MQKKTIKQKTIQKEKKRKREKELSLLAR